VKPRPQDNKGAARLRELFPGRGETVKIAKLCGVALSVANRWRSGERAPSTDNREVLQEKLKIDWRDWDRAVGKRPRAA
jgi:hypothetical protein